MASGQVKALAVFAGLVVCLTAGVVSRAVVTRVLGAREAAAIERQDPYTLMTREFFAHPHQFQVTLARGAQAGVRRNLPEARVTFEDQAVVTNLGSALRAIVAYRGEMPGPNGATLSLDAELRQYFHRGGAVVIETTCVSGERCEVPRDLIDRTDAAVLAHLADEGVAAILPPEGQCEASSFAMKSHVNQMTVCRLEPDVFLSVMRLSLDQTRQELRRIASDPEARAIADKAARDAR